jgi:hypothetical protein
MRSPVGAAAGAVRNRNRERHSPSRHALLIGSRSGLREKQACTTNISSRLPARHSGSELPARVHCVVLDAVFDRALHQTRPLCRAVHVLVALRAMERRGGRAARLPGGAEYVPWYMINALLRQGGQDVPHNNKAAHCLASQTGFSTTRLD